MADEKIIPPIILYGVIIRQAIQSADKEVMRATATVSKFMMDRVDAGADDDRIREWHAAHDELMRALG